jgi:hypothetical protein
MMKQTGRQNNNNWEWQLWQQHNQPIEVTNETLIRQRLDYLYNNPEDWLYGSEDDYRGKKGFWIWFN